MILEAVQPGSFRMAVKMFSVPTRRAFMCRASWTLASMIRLAVGV